MPLVSFPGPDVSDLEHAVAEVERSRARVVQVVGQIGGAWWLLVEEPARAQAVKKAAKKPPVREVREAGR
jgi:hypothetical protein